MNMNSGSNRYDNIDGYSDNQHNSNNNNNNNNILLIFLNSYINLIGIIIGFCISYCLFPGLIQKKVY